MSDVLDRLGVPPLADLLQGNGKPRGYELYPRKSVSEDEPGPESPLEPRALWQPFPVDAIPEPVRQFVAAASRAVGCDPSFVALPLLSALAAAIGNTRVVCIKRGWTEPAVIWTAIIGESGTLKSPAMDLAIRAVRRRQAEAMAQHAQTLQQFQTELSWHERRMADWRRDKSAGDPPEKPQRPICPRYWCSDITVEAVATLLAENPGGVLLVRDELSGWLRSFDAYKGGRGGDVAHWLSMHGARAMVVDRKGREPIHVPRAAVSITGAIPPHILRHALGREHFEDGLAARLLLAMPPREPKHWTENELPSEVEAAMDLLFDHLWRLEAPQDEHRRPYPTMLPLSPEAKRTWIEFYEAHAAQQAELIGDLAAAYSKLEGCAARLALVVHTVRAATGQADAQAVDGQSMQAGVALARWFVCETKRVYGVLAESDEDRSHRELVELIRRKGGAITVRELMRASRQYRDRAELTEAALQDLAKRELGHWQDRPAGPAGGQPTRVFRLHSGR